MNETLREMIDGIGIDCDSNIFAEAYVSSVSSLSEHDKVDIILEYTNKIIELSIDHTTNEILQERLN